MDDTTPWHLLPPGFAEIEQAAARIRGVLRETPPLESERLNRRLLVKAEGLQPTGSFKALGAWNRLLLLTGANVDRAAFAAAVA